MILETPVMHFQLLSHGTVSDYSAALAGVRVSARHLYQNHHKLPGSPGAGEMMQKPLKCYTAPCFISLRSFFPFMRFVDNGEPLAPKVLDYFLYFPLLWRQKNHFYSDFFPTCSIFTLQVFGQQIQDLLSRNVPLFSLWGHFHYYYFYYNII